ncbi:peptidase U32 family protein [Priestia megaterium]|uniref:peptidase U32 family protein n=1 Tax=Priestia megaterium TaxID=1404 RepID=UPI00245347D5|nr:peptidase U32 family protein [Priestia megaterium]MDH3140348.1 U32 family peptidase [Priestia megaterium]MED4239106.1 U32 family peptidase [Priestia megaterium]MED4251650.1 U32 family peptidase [Priestia megaterium]MED4264331.1 U32 family peptidase [Priestia megaterium]MED4277967.1 U32 family peptidase [Priestia megaterium]
MKKPELLVTPTAVSEIESLLQAGATAVIVGEQRYGLRLAGEFKREDIVEAVNIAHQHNAKVYVAMNGLFHNDKIAELNEYILFLKEASVDAIVFGDPAVLMAVRETAPEMKMHWSTETTGTNWYSCNYWGRKGAKRAVLARELSMDSIIDIKEKAEVEIEVQVHGMTCMFQSKRSLLGNYFEYQGKVMEIENRKVEKDMFLLDNERNNKYPIFEDENGTHIMSPNDMCIIDELSEMIDAEVDVFKIDGVLKSPQYILEVTKKYRQAIDLCVDDREEYENVKDDLLEEIESLQPINRPLDTGFFFKETVY